MKYYLTYDIMHVRGPFGRMRIHNTLVSRKLETVIFATKNNQFSAAIAYTSVRVIILIEASMTKSEVSLMMAA